MSATSQVQQQPSVGLAKLMQQSAWAGVSSKSMVTEIKSEPGSAASQVTVKLPTASTSFGVLGSGGLHGPTRRPSSHTSLGGRGGSVRGSLVGSAGQQRKHQQAGNNMIKLKQLTASVSGPGRPKKVVVDGESASSLVNSPALDLAATSSESSGDASSSPLNVGTSSTSVVLVENELLEQQMAVEENRDDVRQLFNLINIYCQFLDLDINLFLRVFSVFVFLLFHLY